jgi:hypothetical protein
MVYNSALANSMLTFCKNVNAPEIMQAVEREQGAAAGPVRTTRRWLRDMAEPKSMIDPELPVEHVYNFLQTYCTAFETLINVAADDLVGKTIMYKWHQSGWCVGEIVRRNTDQRCKLKSSHGQVINFHVVYESDALVAKHALSLRRYHDEGTGNADYQSWVLLETES